MTEQNLSLLWHFFGTSQRVKVLVDAAMDGAPLTPDEYAVYSLLFDIGPLPPTDLARRVGMPPTTMSHYVRALVERGHAERVASPHDGRSYLLALTSAGKAAHAGAARAFERANERFRAALGVDEAFLRRSLDEVGRAADKATAELAGTHARAAG